MKSNKEAINFTLIILSIIIGTGVVLLSIYSKIEFSILVNQLSSESFDRAFELITFLGLGGLLAILAVLFAFVRYYYSILFIGVLISSGLVTYLFKKVLFKSAMRPLHYMADMPLRFPEGIEAHFKYSFPSGHTITIFACAFVLFWIYRNYKLAVINFTIAALVGLSRIYLFQHFLIDVYAGAILGISQCLLVVWIFEYKFKLHKVPVLHQSLSPILVRVFKKKKPSEKYGYLKIKR